MHARRTLSASAMLPQAGLRFRHACGGKRSPAPDAGCAPTAGSELDPRRALVPDAGCAAGRTAFARGRTVPAHAMLRPYDCHRTVFARGVFSGVGARDGHRTSPLRSRACAERSPALGARWSSDIAAALACVCGAPRRWARGGHRTSPLRSRACAERSPALGARWSSDIAAALAHVRNAPAGLGAFALSTLNCARARARNVPAGGNRARKSARRASPRGRKRRRGWR